MFWSTVFVIGDEAVVVGVFFRENLVNQTLVLVIDFVGDKGTFASQFLNLPIVKAFDLYNTKSIRTLLHVLSFSMLFRQLKK